MCFSIKVDYRTKVFENFITGGAIQITIFPHEGILERRDYFIEIPILGGFIIEVEIIEDWTKCDIYI